jgi:hypothetical protein
MQKLLQKFISKVIPAIVALLTHQAAFAQELPLAERLPLAYAKGRVEVLKQLNQRFVLQADPVLKFFMQAGDLEKANMTSAWSKRLLAADEPNDTDPVAPNPASTDRLAVLQTRYLKERAETLTKLNKLYVGQIELSQRQAMQKGDLPGANALNELLAKIKAELGAPAAPPTGGDSLFGIEKQKKWKPNKGEWKWEGSKLLGIGDGSITFDVSVHPPFVAQFKFNSKKGQRAGVLFDGTGIQNAAYSDKFGIPSVDEAKYFAYKHDTVYRCTFVVSKRQTELYVDGKLICTGPGRDKKIEKITINSGDNWSPGFVEVQDLTLLRSTDKVTAP